MSERSPAHEERLNQALLEYRQRVERGEAVDLPLLVSRYADVAVELRQYLKTEALLKELRGALGPGGAPPGKTAPFALKKYRVLKPIGQGGMGQVFLAEHVQLRRRVAIKVLPELFVADSSYLQRFLKEARVIAALEHPNIVRAYECDNVGNTYYLAMEYIEGEDLEHLTRKRGPWSFREAAEFTRQVAAGLAYSHQRGIIHRDIKPGNLLLNSRGVIKILDLGLALTTEESSSLTRQHGENVLGTTDYMSPEQALDSHRVDARSDIYSLGCTLYFLLTGEPPFSGGTMAEKLVKHQMKEPVSLREKRPDVPGRLMDICRKMMAKEVNQRYQSIKELHDDLAQWLERGSGQVAAENSGRLRSRLAETRFDSRRLRIVAGLCALALIVVGLWWSFRALTGDGPPTPSSPAVHSTPGYGPGMFKRGLHGDGLRAGERLPLAKELNPSVFTVMAWIKIGPPDPKAPNVPIRYVFYTPEIALGTQDGTRLYASVTNGDRKPIVVVSEADVLAPDRWSHIAASCDGKTLQVWEGGKGKGTVPIGTARTNLGPVQGFIGQGPSNELFVGVIDEVRLYGRPFHLQEIRSGQQEIPVSPKDLLRHWTFD